MLSTDYCTCGGAQFIPVTTDDNYRIAYWHAIYTCRFNQQQISKQLLIIQRCIHILMDVGLLFVIHLAVVFGDSVLRVHVIFRSCCVGNFFDQCILRLSFIFFPDGLF